MTKAKAFVFERKTGEDGTEAPPYRVLFVFREVGCAVDMLARLETQTKLALCFGIAAGRFQSREVSDGDDFTCQVLVLFRDRKFFPTDPGSFAEFRDGDATTVLVDFCKPPRRDELGEKADGESVVRVDARANHSFFDWFPFPWRALPVSEEAARNAEDELFWLILDKGRLTSGFETKMVGELEKLRARLAKEIHGTP